jgi:hypothetical protein
MLLALVQVVLNRARSRSAVRSGAPAAVQAGAVDACDSAASAAVAVSERGDADGACGAAVGARLWDVVSCASARCGCFPAGAVGLGGAAVSDAGHAAPVWLVGLTRHRAPSLLDCLKRGRIATPAL